MYEFALARGTVSFFFFISFLIIGQMILLNLFIAILLDNFDLTKANIKANENTIEALEMEGLL